jgi:hypothetical protein
MESKGELAVSFESSRRLFGGEPESTCPLRGTVKI